MRLKIARNAEAAAAEAERVAGLRRGTSCREMSPVPAKTVGSPMKALATA